MAGVIPSCRSVDADACCEYTFRARLHRESASTLRQLYDDACNSVLVENNRVTPEWGCNQFLRDSIVFNENSIV